MAHARSLSFVDRRVTPPCGQAETFVGYARDRFALIGEDLAALGDGPLVLAEEPWLLPSLVASTGAAPECACLPPTPEFTALSQNLRADPNPRGTRPSTAGPTAWPATRS